MDLGRARFRQAHKMPPSSWDVAVLAMCVTLIIIIAVIVALLPDMMYGR